MRTKYGFQSPETYLGEIFFKNDDAAAWKKLKTLAGEEDHKIIKNTLSLFHPRFEPIWKEKNRGRLNILKRALRDKKTIEFLDVVAFTFGKMLVKKETITLIILFSPRSGDFTAAGSANLTGNFITLELPDLKKDTWQLSYSIALIGHEIGHLFFKKRDGKEIIEQIVKTLRLKKQYNTLPFGTLSIINEAITAAFVPLGALGQKYFSSAIADILFSDLPRGATAEQSLRKGKAVSYYSNLEMYFVWKLFPLALIYLREKKPVDEAFIKATGISLKELLLQK